MPPRHILPTPWNVYNLRGNPFFQEPLEAEERTPRPLSLFVGRQQELDRLQQHIRGAEGNATRQAIAGSPGVGKTTLAKELKARLLADGYMASDSLVAVSRDDTTESLFARVLNALFDTIIANRLMAADNQALVDAQVMVRATRLTTGASIGVSVPGLGGSVSRSQTVLRPDMMIDGPRIVRDLSRFVLGSDARGVVLHINNLENLTEKDARQTADIIRDLRDPLFFQNGLHFVFVGTTEAVDTVVNTHAQVRSTVTVHRLEPLTIAEVHQALAARYEHLRMDERHPVQAPVAQEAVATLHTLYRGDLRGVLKALDEGVTPLLGLARSVTLDELRETLRGRYQTELASRMDGKRLEQLNAWGTKDPATAHTQKSLKALWKVSQAAVSNAVTSFVQQGYVVALPRVGAEPIQYVLSGVSRLIFG
jgi:Cdc6-like AAA superfamily ATPase